MGVNRSVPVHPVEARGQQVSWTWAGSLWTSPGCSCQLISPLGGEGRRGGHEREEEGRGRDIGRCGWDRRVALALGKSVIEIKDPPQHYTLSVSLSPFQSCMLSLQGSQLRTLPVMLSRGEITCACVLCEHLHFSYFFMNVVYEALNQHQ